MTLDEKNLAAWQLEKKGPLTVSEAQLWEPGNGEVRIKVRAAAVQPAEGKIAHLGIMPLAYPLILGSTCSGIVDALGPGVTKVQVGDRVAAGLDNYANRGDPARASHQRFAIAAEREVVDIGPDLGFADAVSANTQTPAAALFKFLGLEYPTVPVTKREQTVLIWGGSGAMGLLSIRYAKLAGYRIVATASQHNFDLVREAGADEVYDRNDPELFESLTNVLPIDFWFDTIALPATVQVISKLAEKQREAVGKDINIVTLLPASLPGYPELPAGIRTQMMLFRGKLEENQGHVEWLMGKGGYLEKGLKDGSIKGVPAEVVGGLDAVQEATARVLKGVSAKKLVVDPWLDVKTSG